MSNFSQYFYLLESPNAKTKDDESQLATSFLSGHVLDGNQRRAEVGICRVEVEMLRTFQTRPVVTLKELK